MDYRAAEIHQAITALGRRAPHTPYSPEIRRQVLVYAAARRQAGASWAEIAGAVGISLNALNCWRAAPGHSENEMSRPAAEKTPAKEPAVPGPTAARLLPVVVREERPEAELMLVTPSGYRVSGLAVEQVLSLLRALG